MRRIIYLTIIIISSSILESKAFLLSGFNISPQYLSTGKIFAPYQSSIRQIKFNFQIVKSFEAYGNGALEDFSSTKNVTVKLVYWAGNVQSNEVVWGTKQVTNADFNTAPVYSKSLTDLTVNATIPAYTGSPELGKVYLKYSYYNGYTTVNEYTNINYNLTQSAPVNPYLVYSPYSNSKPMFRIYKSNGDHHLLTLDETEGRSFGNLEEILCFGKNTQELGTIPLYRFYRYQNGDHYFTTSSTRPSGYASEGIPTYVYSSLAPNTQPIYVYAKYSGGDHVYTKNYSELGGGNSIWRYDGIAFYGLK